MAEDALRQQVIARRLHVHHLDRRLPIERLLDAAGACAIQDSPPGSALTALHARLHDVTAQCVRDSLVERKSLLQTWSMRGAPFCFPTADAALFTAGVLPPTEAATLHLLPGVEPALRDLRLSVTAAVELTAAELDDVLTGNSLAINELGAQVAARIAPHLAARQRVVWEGPGPYAAGQPLGEGVVHFCLRVLTLKGQLCFGPRVGNKAPFVLVKEWLGHPIPAAEPQDARAGLLRKYLHCYGPSTRAGFAAWMGLHASDVEPWWKQLAGELTKVTWGRPAWMLTEDAATLGDMPTPQGARLLPPRDPYTQGQDRDTIADAQFHTEIWKSVGEPGTMVVDGVIAGTWRTRKQGGRLTMTLSPFAPLSVRSQRLLEEEAASLGSLRGATALELTWSQ